MQEEIYIVVGGLISLIGLYWGVEKFNERGQKRVDIVNQKLEKIAEESNASNKELTKAIHELTKMMELMNQNMMGTRELVEKHDKRLVSIEKRLTSYNNRCAFEHKRIAEE